MRSKDQKIINHLTSLQKQIELIKKELYLDSNKYEIIAIHRDGFSFVGVNDHLGNGDRVIICSKEKVEEDLIKRAIQSCFNGLNYTHENIVNVYSDMSEQNLDENYIKFIDVMGISYLSVEDELVGLIRSEYEREEKNK